MEAKVHDEIVVDAVHIGEPPRKGEILEVIDRGDVVHYRVRWDDGHESIFFPASTAHVVHTRDRG
jgi:predicted amidohydrolase